MPANKKPQGPAIKKQNAGAFRMEAAKESGNPLLNPRTFSWEKK